MAHHPRVAHSSALEGRKLCSKQSGQYFHFSGFTCKGLGAAAFWIPLHGFPGCNYDNDCVCDFSSQLFWIHLSDLFYPDNGFRSHSDRTVQASNGVFWEISGQSGRGWGTARWILNPIVRGEKDIMCDALKSACNKRENNSFPPKLACICVCEESFNVKEKRAGCYCGEKVITFNMHWWIALFILKTCWTCAYVLLWTTKGDVSQNAQAAL